MIVKYKFVNYTIGVISLIVYKNLTNLCTKRVIISFNKS